MVGERWDSGSCCSQPDSQPPHTFCRTQALEDAPTSCGRQSSTEQLQQVGRGRVADGEVDLLLFQCNFAAKEGMWTYVCVLASLVLPLTIG